MIPAPPTDESDSVLPVRLSVTLLGLQLETWDEGSQTLSGRHCSSLQHCSVSSCCLGIIIIMNSSSMLLFECVSIIWNEDHQMCQSNQWINECWFDGIMMAPILTVSHNPASAYHHSSSLLPASHRTHGPSPGLPGRNCAIQFSENQEHRGRDEERVQLLNFKMIFCRRFNLKR